MSKKVYLSGPDVFLPDALEILGRKAAMCAEFGFEANLPHESHVDTRCSATPANPSQLIYETWVGLMKTSDFGIFNLTPFRGVSADVGTIFELGMMTGLGKPTFGYTNIAGDYIDRIAPRQLLDPKTGAWTDDDDMRIENFGNADNLMVDESIAVGVGGTPLVRLATPLLNRFQALEGFRDCLKQAQAWFAAHP
jgi:nucleoside 2-deoxyribosyltransferase